LLVSFFDFLLKGYVFVYKTTYIHRHELTHVDITKRELIYIESILFSLRGSEQFYMGEEQFSLYYNQVSLVKDQIPDLKVDGPKLYGTPNHL